jgi:hypothetical protein
MWVAGCHVRFGGNGEVRKRAGFPLRCGVPPHPVWMQAGTISQRFAQPLVEEWPAVAVYLGEEGEEPVVNGGPSCGAGGAAGQKATTGTGPSVCGKHDGEGDREKPGRPDSPSSGGLQGTTGFLDPVTHRIREGPGEPGVMNR